MARDLARAPKLNTVLRASGRSANGFDVTVERHGTRDEITADYFVSALPATTLRHVRFHPQAPRRSAARIDTLR